MNEIQDIITGSGLSYYINMKEFERKQEKKSNIKYKKLSSEEKLILHESIKDSLVDRFDLDKLKKVAELKSLEINNYDDLFEYFSKIDLFELFKKAELIDKFFPCAIINDNYAWISKSKSGHYRYFSRSNGKNEETIGFDFIDLMEVVYGVPTLKTIDMVVNSLKIKFMEGIWMNEQNRKYLSNLTLIHNSKKHIEFDYPILYSYIKNHLKFLETMNVLGNLNIKKQDFSFENQNIFFCSNSYIANFLGNYTSSTANKILNLFAVLGIINKISEKNVPSQLLHESRAIAEKRNLGNIVSYYTIPPMIEVINNANNIAKVLEEHNIKHFNITKAKVEFALGQAFTEKIYVQEIQKNKKKNEVALSIVHMNLEGKFMKIIEEKGYISKDMLIKTKISKTDLKQKENEVNKIWKTLIMKHQLRYIKPTTLMKKQFKLKTNEYIAIK